MLHLHALQTERVAQGDTFEMHYTPEGNLKCVVH